MDATVKLFVWASLVYLLNTEVHGNLNLNDEDEIVGNTAARMNFNLARARARARAIARRTGFNLHHPATLLQPTPEQFMNGNKQKRYKEFEEDPVLGSSAIFSDDETILGDALPYSNLYEGYAPHLSISPGLWKNGDYNEEYYKSYQVTPVSFQIPDDYQNYYRAVELHPHLKKSTESSDFRDKRHFSGHNIQVHPHIHESQIDVHNTGDLPNSLHSSTPYGHGIPPNKYSTANVVPHQTPRQSFMEDQHPRPQTLPSAGCDFSPFESVVGAPRLIAVKRNRKVWQVAGPGEADVNVVIKRSPQRSKRSIPLLRLLVDPNAHLDVPKTLEKAGTAVRNSFENRHAPVYHLNNAVGSARDAFLSTLSIPPQDLFIPSKYKIIENNSDYQYSAPNSIRKDLDTYNKVGSMFRDSIRSGQNALTHMGDVIHSTRKALASSRYVVPKLAVSSMRIPTLQHPLLDRFTKPFETRNDVGTPRSYNNNKFVDISELMDSLGLFHLANDGDYFVISEEMVEDKVNDMVTALDNAKRSIGATSLRDFFSKLRNFKSTRNAETVSKPKSISLTKNENSQIDAINELDMAVALASNVTDELLRDVSSETFWDSREEKGESHFEQENKDEYPKISRNDEFIELVHENPESVGVGMAIGRNLQTPFMGKLKTKVMHDYRYPLEKGDFDYRNRRSSMNFL
ncbi:hypothetical protein FQA39_LY17332 [Lamprigera yunnana]|nr:hypothetical protein FQA39_LY17332 [Lamprigera yunnana]